jgi:hypothetical protein
MAPATNAAAICIDLQLTWVPLENEGVGWKLQPKPFLKQGG